MNSIKSRIKSVNGTMQITKAMELVATSKLRKAKLKAESSRPYGTALRKSLSAISSSSEADSSVWSSDANAGRPLYIVIAGDRGLAGGYNSNVFRLTASLCSDKEPILLPIGKKALEHFKNSELFSSAFDEADEISVGDCFEISDMVCRAFVNGEIGSVTLIYTRFDSMITQTPTHVRLLPLEATDDGEKCDLLFGGDPEEILTSIVSSYVCGEIYSAVCEALASESGARRTAMNAANKNAEEMISDLMLRYNRARQAVITQEITEIVSGAEAL